MCARSSCSRQQVGEYRGASGELAPLNVNLVPAAESRFLVCYDQQTTRQRRKGGEEKEEKKTIRNSSPGLALSQVLATDKHVKSVSECHLDLRRVRGTFSPLLVVVVAVLPPAFFLTE